MNVAFDYTLWGIDEITDLRVEADVDLGNRTAVLRSVTEAATGAAYDPIDIRYELEQDAVVSAEEEMYR